MTIRDGPVWRRDSSRDELELGDVVRHGGVNRRQRCVKRRIDHALALLDEGEAQQAVDQLKMLADKHAESVDV